MLIIPFFREGKIDGATLRTYLHEEYGTEKRARATSDLAIVRLWTERPWFHGGLLTRKYVFLFDMFQSEDKLPGISAFIAYLDAWNFADLREDTESEQAAKKAAAEKAKTDARKGL